MIAWMTYWIWWFTWRVAITLVCAFTIQHVIHEETGYIWLETKPLLLATACAVVLIRVWSTRREPSK